MNINSRRYNTPVTQQSGNVIKHYSRLPHLINLQCIWLYSSRGLHAYKGTSPSVNNRGTCWNFNYLLQYVDIRSRLASANSEHGEKPRVLLGMRAFVSAAQGQIRPCVHSFRLVLLL